MGNLIKFEFRKVLRSKYMYIIFGIGILGAFVTPLMIVASNLVSQELGMATTPFSGYLSAKTALSSSFSTFIGIFIGIFATEDFAQHTNKNIIARGYHRLQLYFSKYIVSLILCVAFAILQILFSLILGFALFGDGGLSIDDNVAVIFLGQLVCVLAFHAFFFGVSYAVNRTGLAIVINLIATSGISTILGLIDAFANNQELKLSYYWIDGVLLNLSQPYTDTDKILPGLLIMVGLIGLSHLLGILVARKKQF